MRSSCVGREQEGQREGGGLLQPQHPPGGYKKGFSCTRSAQFKDGKCCPGGRWLEGGA